MMEIAKKAGRPAGIVFEALELPFPSWPGLSRPSTPASDALYPEMTLMGNHVDARDKPGHDGGLRDKVFNPSGVRTSPAMTAAAAAPNTPARDAL